MEHNGEIGKMRTKSRYARPTIGLLIGNVWDPIAWDVWMGVDNTAKERGVNLICFAGEDLDTPFEFFAQANVLYDLVSAENVDGLVIWGGGLGQYVSPETVQALCEQYRPLPMVNAALPLTDIPSVLLDNYQSMRDAITHLVKVHGYRRIAFIRGPKGHPEAEARYRAYRDVLIEHDLPLAPNLVAPGDFNPDSGIEAVNLWLDQHKLRPQIDFEAIAAADDGMAISAIQTLQARGIQVPGDVAVTGFDNIAEGWYNTPSLTTVPALVYEQAQRATEMLLALLKGEKVPERVLMPSRVTVRESCGCSTPTVAWGTEGAAASAGGTFETALVARQEEILSAMVRAVEAFSFGIVPGGAEQLLDAFLKELMPDALGSASPGVFLLTLGEILRQGMATGGDVTAWQGAISALRYHVLTHLDDNERVTRAESLWYQAGVMIGEMAKRVQVQQRVQAQQRWLQLNQVSQSLITKFDVAELMDVAAEGLPYLEIERAYISLYEVPEAPVEWSRLILAYDEKRRVALEADGRRFPSRQLVPDDLLPRDRRYSLVVEPLYFQEDQLGFAVFEAAPHEATMYDALRGHISSALKGALVVQHHRLTAIALQSERDFADSLVETAPVIVLLLDTQGRILRFNSYLERVSGYQLREVLGQDWFVTFVPRREQDLARAAFTEAVSGTQTLGRVTSIVTKAGHERQIEWSGETLQAAAGDVIGLLAIGQDVTERKQAEKRLTAIYTLGQKLILSRDVNEIANSVIAAAQQVLHLPVFSLWLVDGKRRELVHWVQVPEPEVPEVPPIPLDQEQSIIASVVRSGEPIYLPDMTQDPRYRTGSFPSRSELCIPLKVGNKVIGALNTASVHMNDFGLDDIQLLEALANAAAIAVRNARLYEEVRNRAERLATANRIAEAANRELKALAYSISHDLRAPLRHVDGFVQLLLQREGGRLDLTSAHYLQVIAESSKKMGQLIDDLLALSRTGRTEMQVQRVELSELIQIAQQELAPLLEGRRITWEIGPLPAIEGDPALLRRVWVHLLSNAIKYTAPRAEARIEIGVAEDAGAKDEVTLFVRDNGVGFDSQYAHKLFGVFQRLHREDEFEGTGIGLATVHRIVQRHGGRVWAEGELDRGAIFYFTLPLWKAAHERETGATHGSQTDLAGGR